jgi:hypothetical protein
MKHLKKSDDRTSNVKKPRHETGNQDEEIDDEVSVSEVSLGRGWEQGVQPEVYNVDLESGDLLDPIDDSKSFPSTPENWTAREYHWNWVCDKITQKKLWSEQLGRDFFAVTEGKWRVMARSEWFGGWRLALYTPNTGRELFSAFEVEYRLERQVGATAPVPEHTLWDWLDGDNELNFFVQNYWEDTEDNGQDNDADDNIDHDES